MREFSTLLFSFCALLLAAELIAHLFPDKDGKLIHGLAVISILLSLLLGLRQIELPEIEFSSAKFSGAAETDTMAAETGAAILRERLAALLTAAGVTLPKGEDDIEIRYRQSEDGAVTVESVQARVRYAEDIPRAEALLRNVLTDAIPTEVIKNAG